MKLIDSFYAWLRPAPKLKLGYCLDSGNGVRTHYVRANRSIKREEVVAFCDDWAGHKRGRACRFGQAAQDLKRGQCGWVSERYFSKADVEFAAKHKTTLPSTFYARN